MKTWSRNKPLSNYALVLRYIFRNQPVSRSNIVEDLNLPRSLVTAITSSLIEKGLIHELGKEENAEGGAPGRRRLLIGIEETARYSIGVEIASSRFQFCLTDLAGHVLQEHSYAPTQEQIHSVNRSIEAGVRELVEKSGIPHDRLIGVGISVPGHMCMQNGSLVTHSSQWGNLNTYALADSLQLKVTAENNVRCMAYGEYFFQMDSCPESFVLLHVGAGIFCAEFKDGRLMRGSYIFGEVGHTVCNPNGIPCGCGKTGCLQAYASETALLTKARLIWEQSADSILRQLAKSPEEISIDLILHAYHLGDELVVRVIREALRYLGTVAANLAIILGPQKFYLHSRVFQEKTLCRELRRLIEEQLSFIVGQNMEEVVVLNYEPTRSAIGASAVAIDRLLIREG